MKKPTVQLIIEGITFDVWPQRGGNRLTSHPCEDARQAEAAVRSKFPHAEYIQSDFHGRHDFFISQETK